VRATMKGLTDMQSPTKIAAKRGKKVEDLVNG
jgi:small subunit ribosomal protein S5